MPPQKRSESDMAAGPDEKRNRRALLPPSAEYYVATVTSLRNRNGNATISQIEKDVADILRLSPDALSLPHGDGRRSQYQYDLAWVRTYLKWAGAVTNEQRGKWALTVVGDAMSDDELRLLWKRVVDQQRAERKSLPTLPQQGSGPHFAIHNGVLAFAGQVDNRGNDTGRIRSLKPIIEDTAKGLLDSLERHEGLWPSLERAAKEYQRLVSADLNNIDFGRLFGQGIILSNAVRMAKLAPDTGNAYPLAPEPSVLADSLLEMHGPFVLGSKDGQELVADTERYDSTSAELALVKANELELSRAIGSANSPATLEVRQHINDVIEIEHTTSRTDRHAIYLDGLVRNATIIFVGGAALSSVAAIALTGGAVPAAIAALAASIFGKEAVKNSKAGRELSTQLTKLVDRATVDFVNENESLFRALSTRRNMEWLGKALDWSLAQREKTRADVDAPVGNPPTNDGFRPKVLLLDSDMEFSSNLRTTLADWGYELVFAARSRYSAIEWARQSPIDILISETVLSAGDSGIETALEITKIQNAPVIFLTANPEHLLQQPRPEPIVLVTKPFQPSDLRAKLAQAKAATLNSKRTTSKTSP